jgi:uncharacterized protein (TIRG00374 family)
LLFILGLAGVLALIYRLAGPEVFLRLREVHPGWATLYLVMACAVVTGHSLRWRVAARALGECPLFPRFVAARLAGEAVATLLPATKVSGDPVRIALLAADGASMSTAAASVAVDRMLEMTSNLIAAVLFVGTFAFAQMAGVEAGTLLTLGLLPVVMLLILGVPVALLWHGRRPLAPVYRIAGRWRAPRWATVIDGVKRAEEKVMRLLQEHPRTVVAGLVVSLAVEGLVVIEYHALLRAFGVSLPLPVLLIALVASGVSRAVPTPGGVGALEASQVGVITLTVGQATQGVVVGLLMRIHETLWMAIGLGVCLARGVSLRHPRSTSPKVLA